MKIRSNAVNVKTGVMPYYTSYAALQLRLPAVQSN